MTTRLAFPTLGNYSIALATAVESLGIEAYATTATTPTAMQLGMEASPDSVCLPFKSHLGHYIEAAQQGVKYALMVNSLGTCRLRYYRPLCERILKERGYDIRLFGLGFDGIKPPLIRHFDPPLWPFLRKVAQAVRKMRVIDRIEQEAWRRRPLEVRPGETTRVTNQLLDELHAARTSRQTRALARALEDRFDAIEIDEDRRPLKIGLVGEISILRDRTLNHDLEDKLGRLGCDVRNWFLLGSELGNIFHIGFRDKNTRRYLKKVARPYLEVPIGGHALDSLAHTIRCAQEGWDAMIHVAPAGCMPEVSVRPILRRVSEDFDIPVLTLSFDEHTSAIGVTTRLEAFVDVVLDRRAAKQRGAAPALPAPSVLEA